MIRDKSSANEVFVKEKNQSQPFVDELINENIIAKEEKSLIKDKLREYGFFNEFFLFTIIITLISIVIYIVARYNSNFAEFFTRYPGSYLRAFLGYITSFIPFSIAEAILILLPVFAIAYIVHSITVMKKDARTSAFTKKLIPLICVIMIMFSTFVITFSTGYFRYPLEKNLNLVKNDVSVEDLRLVAIEINSELTELEKDINFNFESSSYMNYSFDSLVEKINIAFDDFASDYDFISHFNSKPKQVVLSVPMTYTQISGVFSFFTGEANININFPDYIQPFTVAHEMAHQRGISREDEANLVAFLVCMRSDDSYIRYSGLLNINEYVLSALRKASSNDYSQMYYSIPGSIRHELKAYSDFYNSYKNKTVSTVTKTINNTFLQSQGQTEGLKSYGMVVDLIVAYYKSID
ncbi:MAG: hypothetical protein A2Y17_03300 [Clostridiales bacterium GWF2_38_85]|nr:MAG: hypothetical protein A2Y17_03300 [Clostridiales bacterium GWF2_38_85]